MPKLHSSNMQHGAAAAAATAATKGPADWTCFECLL